MHLSAVFAIVALFAIESPPEAVPPTPFLVVNIDERFLADPLIAGFLADVLRRGGLGYRNSESAAFLVRDGGGYRCVTWPFSGEVQAQTFEGGHRRERLRSCTPTRSRFPSLLRATGASRWRRAFPSSSSRAAQSAAPGPTAR